MDNNLVPLCNKSEQIIPKNLDGTARWLTPYVVHFIVNWGEFWSSYLHSPGFDLCLFLGLIDLGLSTLTIISPVILAMYQKRALSIHEDEIF